ncbi:MAG: acyltransferase family protein [Methylococcales bacterium]
MNQKKERIYYLDAMRGVLMMLGVFLHSAQVFNPAKGWIIYSEDSSILSAYLVDIIHTFRMPAFFIVSGYFCLLTIKRYGPDNFLNIRIKRIVIPLIITALTLNSIQTYILTKYGWISFNLETYLTEGEWVSHLWFLNNLIIYFLFAYFFARFFSKSISSLNSLIERPVRKIPFISIIFILPLIWISIKIMGKMGFPLYIELFGFLQLYDIFLYLPYFLFGIWLRGNENYLDKFSSINPIISIILMTIFYFISEAISQKESMLNNIINEYSKNIIIWFAASLCFYIFKKFTNKHSKFFYFLSDASYSVYLFHNVIVIILGIILINNNIGGTLGLVITIVSTCLISFFIHHYFISKVATAKYLFNGK